MIQKLKTNSIQKHSFFYCAFLCFISCGSDKKTHPELLPLTEAVYASGNIKAYNQYMVYSGVTGILKKKYLNENDFVNQGQIIAEIDNDVSSYQLEDAQAALLEAQKNSGQDSPVLQQLNAEIESARIKYQDDSVNHIRFSNLLKENACSRSEYESKQLLYQTSKNRYAELLLKKSDTKNNLNRKYKGALSMFKVNASYKNQRLVQSLINGKIYGFYKKPGELVLQNDPIAMIGDRDHFLLELQVDELDVNKIKTGQQVLVTLDTYNNRLFNAKIVRIAPSLDKQTKTLNVEAEFEDVPDKLYPGLTAEANIIVQKKSKTLVIPRVYLLPGDSVRISKSEKVKVKTGLKNIQYVEILSGLDTSSTLYK